MFRVRDKFTLLAAGTLLIGALATAASDLSTLFPPGPAVPTQDAFLPISATVVDLRANPDDLSPAVDAITTKIQDALAANQEVVLLVGEEHSTALHVRLPALVWKSLRDKGESPAIAVEINHNFLERTIPSFFPDKSQDDLRARTEKALSALKKDSPARYRHLQALAYTAWNWPSAPASRLADSFDWIDGKAPIYLIDIAGQGVMDPADPDTNAFLRTHATDREDINQIPTATPEGMRLRNEWMTEKIRTILNADDIRAVIVETGLDHVVGDSEEAFPYDESLYASLTKEAGKNVRVIAVIPEDSDTTLGAWLPEEALAAMDQNTVILLHGNGVQHNQYWAGTFEEEIATLSRWSPTPAFRDEDGYNALRNTFKAELLKDLEAVTAQYTAKKEPQPPATRTAATLKI